MSVNTQTRAWLLAMRLPTLVIGAAPVVVAFVLASAKKHASLLVFGVTLVTTLCLQIATNLHNDAADFERGTDKQDQRLGPPRAASMGWLTPSQLHVGTLISLLIAALCGGWLVWYGGWIICAIGVVSAITAIAYTGGPWPLAYHGLGECVAFLFFGPVAVCGAYFLHTGWVSQEAWVAGFALGYYAAAILGLNNLRDVTSDAAAGKRTLAVRFGVSWQRRLIAMLLILPLLLIVALAVQTHRWEWALPTVLLIPTIRLIQKINQSSGAALNASFSECPRMMVRFSLLLTAGALL